jgi:hypothetical protein
MNVELKFESFRVGPNFSVPSPNFYSIMKSNPTCDWGQIKKGPMSCPHLEAGTSASVVGN